MPSASTDRADPRPPRGFSLLEVALAFTLLTVVGGAVLLLMSESAKIGNLAAVEGDLNATMDRLLPRLKAEIQDSGKDADGTDYLLTHPDDQVTAATSTITFQARIGITKVATQDWTTAITYRLEDEAGEDPSNGEDDDGDGVVDERAVVREQDGRSQVIALGVTALAFSRASPSNTIDLTVTGQRFSTALRELKSRTVTTSISLRNID